ncbi:MAG: LicD family protein, partial [Lachnospiraceae bacterium]|nr:LicD family protein [Lachnospiraceae bacterium]
MMKRAWAAQLEVLDILDKLFRENDLKYFIAYGTLIGAVRHKGFIPWDDDMDIWMPRKDYEKLREMAKNNLLPKDCIFKDSRFYKDYEATFPRIINYASIGFDEDRLEKYHGFPFCAGM